jgi:hypothetical protein
MLDKIGLFVVFYFLVLTHCLVQSKEGSCTNAFRDDISSKLQNSLENEFNFPINSVKMESCVVYHPDWSDVSILEVHGKCNLIENNQSANILARILKSGELEMVFLFGFRNKDVDYLSKRVYDHAMYDGVGMDVRFQKIQFDWIGIPYRKPRTLYKFEVVGRRVPPTWSTERIKKFPESAWEYYFLRDPATRKLREEPPPYVGQARPILPNYWNDS